MFLLFIVLFIQKIILLKIFGVILINLIYPRTLLHENKFTLKFYLLIILYIVVGSSVYLYRYNYYIPFLLSIVFWTLSYLASKQTYYFVSRSTSKDVNNIIKLLFCINILAFVANYVELFLFYGKIFPFFSINSAGDFMKSIYANSSIAMIIFSIFFVHFVCHKKLLLSCVALTMLLLTAYMSGILLFLGCAVAFSFFYAKIKNSTRVLIVISAFIAVCIIFKILPTNITYVRSILMNIDATIPRKLVSFFQTYSYLVESVQNFLFGAGSGNFSSRLAFMCAGEYVSWFPTDFIYLSNDFRSNHFSLWNYELLSIGYNDGTVNQPFSFYNKIFGEYGLIGAILFVIYYLKPLICNRRSKRICTFLVPLLLGYFLLDYWFEYFSVIVIYELVFLANCSMEKDQYHHVVGVDS